MIDTFQPAFVRSRRADLPGQPVFPWLGSERPRIAEPPAIASPTSRAAARRIAVHAPRLYDRILDHFRRAGRFGATDEEGGTALQIPGNSYRPRRGALARDGLIVAVGKRPTKSGDLAYVWRLAEGAT